MIAEPGAASPCSRLGIVGLGLIGGSIALRARAAWPAMPIVGLDRPEPATLAQRRGVVGEIASDLEDLASSDLIVLATPVAAILELIPALARLNTQAIVTDVGSTKREVMAAARSAGLPSFVGGHPMAGSERGGLDHARADLFDHRPWLLMHGRGGDLERVEAFVRSLGAVPHRTEAEVHDRTMAYVSHLPQVIAVALMNAADESVGPGGLAMAGQAFADMTRVASSPGGLWEGILAQNTDFVREALERFLAHLPPTDDGRRDQWVREAFGQAGAARERWKGTDRRSS